MTNIRPLPELLQVFLDNQDLFNSGLCKWITRLSNQGVITKDEYNYLETMLEDEAKIRDKSPLEHIWPSGEISYRIEWLKSKLEKK